MDIKKIVEIAQAIVSLAEKEGWSEEEIAKAINLLHSELSITPLIQMNPVC